MSTYVASYLVMASIYAIAVLALNFQWGFTGLMNFGIGAFYMLGAYSAAILSAPPSPEHLGGFGVPFPLDLIAAVLIPGVVAFLVGYPALQLSGAPFAIATLAIHETLYLIVHNERWLTNGVWGIRGIPRPFYEWMPQTYDFFYLGIALVVLVFVYFLIEKLINSPWGRVARAIRGDEKMTEMSGKDVWKYKMQSFVFGSMVIGLAGGVYVHYTGLVSPTVFSPLMSIFIVWLMMIVGGTGNNIGVILGAFIVWGIWTGSDFLTGFLPAGSETQIGFVRMLLLGILLVIIVLIRPQGILGKQQMMSLEKAEQD